MTNNQQQAISFFSALAFVVLLLAFFIEFMSIGTAAPDRAREVLSARGLLDIRIYGSDSYACRERTWRTTEFKGKIHGCSVDGVLCSPLFSDDSLVVRETKCPE